MIHVNEWPRPWPLKAMVDQLQRGSTLRRLTEPKRSIRWHDVREYQFENIAESVLVEYFGRENIITRKKIATILNIPQTQFPTNARPDLIVRHCGSLHLCELKASRKDYNRYHKEMGPSFRKYLNSIDYTGPAPYEVEQDLIKLFLYRHLSERVGSCLFLMVDAYEGPSWSWSAAFQEKSEFLRRMHTPLISGMADELLEFTQIRLLESESADATANLITCEVQSVTQ